MTIFKQREKMIAPSSTLFLVTVVTAVADMHQ